MKQEIKQEIKQEMKQESKDHSSREWVSPIPEVEVGGSAPGGPYVRARKDIPRGARFGPYLGKWAGEPFNPRYAWEVSRILQLSQSIQLVYTYISVCVCVFIVSAPAFEFSSRGSRGVNREANRSVLHQFKLTF